MRMMPYTMPCTSVSMHIAQVDGVHRAGVRNCSGNQKNNTWYVKTPVCAFYC